MHVYKTYLKDVIMRLLIYAPVIVNDVIILLILTTRPKEERSNAFHYPPEVPAVNNRLLVSMNHWPMRTLHSIQDQDHSIIVKSVESVKCQFEGAGRETVFSYLPSPFSRPYTYHSLSHNS